MLGQGYEGLRRYARRAIGILRGGGPGGRFGIGRWVVLSLLIGAVAGLGAAALQDGITTMNRLLLLGVAGFGTPGLPSEGGRLAQVYLPSYRWWLLLLVLAGGGLVSGFIIYTWAPEAEGHGTDAVIRAFHREGGYIRAQVPIVKIIASAITLGSGGSGGREGPIAQIGAGFGSWFATLLRVPDYERRLMVIAGAAGGIGAIFRAPLGGALVVCEILYRNMEFEYEAILPAILTSVVAYTVYALIDGWSPMFRTSGFFFNQPRNLLIYLALGVFVAALGWAYVTVFYGARDRFFARLPIPRMLRPAVGGLLTGLVGLAAPQALALGYGWVQMGMLDRLSLHDYLAGALGKIVATAFTIGSGGSGGVFGPAVVIGGFAGGAVGTFFAHLFPGWHLSTQNLILVGMAAFFGGAAKAPIGSVLMISEMTIGYGLLVPLMLATAIAVALVPKRVGIYEEQVDGSINSPAHFGRYLTEVVQGLRQAAPEMITLTGEMTVAQVRNLFRWTSQELFPVADPHDPSRVAGLVSRRELEKAIFSGLTSGGKRVAELRLSPLGCVSFMDVEVDPASPAAGHPIRDLQLGEGVLLVAVRRDDRTFVPAGHTTLEAGDHVIVVAGPERGDRVLDAFHGQTGRAAQRSPSTGA
jgi:CIC family chloride channel protein